MFSVVRERDKKVREKREREERVCVIVKWRHKCVSVCIRERLFVLIRERANISTSASVCVFV